MSGRAISLNHVSVIARDLEEGIRFYEEVLGLERVPTPNFGSPIQWLRAGDRQLHLFERSGEAPTHAHVAFEIDDFMGVYRRAKQRGLLDHDTFGSAIRELPGGAVQMYIRDPSGNLVEVDHRDAPTVPLHEVPEYTRLADVFPQDGDAARARLFETDGEDR